MSRSIPQANVYGYLNREPVSTPAQATELRSVAIVPAYQVRDAFTSTGAVSETARVDFDVNDLLDVATKYNGWHYAAAPKYAALPGLRQGAKVDADSVNVYFATGTGSTERTRRLFSAQNETVILSGVTASATTDYVGAGPTWVRLTLTSTAVNFELLMDSSGVYEWNPSDNPAVVPFPNPNSPDPTRESYAHIILDDLPDYPIIVTSWTATQLIGFADLRIGHLADVSKTFSVVRDPAQFRVVTEDEKAFLPAAFGPAASNALGAGFTAVNFDTSQAWVIETKVPVADDDAALEVVITHATRTILIYLAKVATAVDVVGNAVAAINAAIETKFFAMQEEAGGVYRPSTRLTKDGTVQPDWVPVRIFGTGNVIDAAGPHPLAVFGATGGLGYLRATTAGVATNGKVVTVQVPASVNAALTVTTTATTVVISLGTTLEPDPAGTVSVVKNTLFLVNQALATAGAGVGFVFADESLPVLADTEYLDQYGLGQYWNHLGFKFNSFSDDQSHAMSGGLRAGSLEVFGGILPFYDLIGGPGARVYAAYRALRTDLTASASLNTTGTHPQLTRLDADTYLRILGDVSSDNPAAVFADQYFLGGNRVPLYLLSPAEVTAEDPWGTETALQGCLDFLRVRPGYHVYLASDAYTTMGLAYNYVAGLGGTATEPLTKPIRVYIPTKNPVAAPDTFVGSGDGSSVADGSAAMTADVDFSELGVLPGDVIVFEGLEYISYAGTVSLQNGQSGYVVNAVNAFSPYSLTFTVPTETGVDFSNRAFTVYRTGASLVVGGAFQADLAVTALEAWNANHVNYRLIKHHVDTYETPVSGAYRVLDGTYMLANLASVIANHPFHMPVSQKPYPLVRRVRGTSGLYTDAQLSRLTGAGLILPVSREGDDSATAPVYVRRDVSSDTSTIDLRRRSAGVAEDMLNIRVDQIVRPRLGPALVTDEILALIAADLTGLVEQFKNDIFRVLSLSQLRSITDDDRATYGINDTGVFIAFRVVHHQELSAAISVVTVAQEVGFIVTPGTT